MITTYHAFHTAERAGAINGFVLGSLTLAQLALALAGLSTDAQQALGGMVLVTDFIAFLVIGIVVRRRAGLVDAGMRAGLMSGAFAGTMAAAGVTALAILAPHVDISAAVGMAPTATGVGATLFAGLVNLAMLAAIGAGLGLAGALSARPRTAAPAVRSSVRLRGHFGR